MAPLPRLLAGLDPATPGPISLGRHRRLHGEVPSPDAESLIAEVEASGLRGRGGADFPTALKLRAVARRGRRSVLVVNGSETEPASEKDALLLLRLPHLVLDGAVLAARAIGAREVIVRAPAAARGVEPALREAVAQRPERDVALSVVRGGRGYVAGEETAVINGLAGGPGLPTFVGPRPFERGLHGRPTLVQNPETLAQLALVARHGSAWYRSIGTAEDPGSVLVSVGGAVRHPGVFEIAFGTTIDDLLGAAGGPDEPLQAVLIGGYFGSWVPADRARELSLARGELRGAGANLGSGVIFALGRSACGLHESARIIAWLAGQSAGQCGPCHHGLPAIAEAFHALVASAGGGHGRASGRLQHLFGEVRGRGACHHPDGAIRFAESALRVFGPELRRHAGQACADREAGLPLPAGQAAP